MDGRHPLIGITRSGSKFGTLLVSWACHTAEMGPLDRLLAIRARNLARYSPESRAQAAVAMRASNLRWRACTVAALLVGGVAQAGPIPIKIIGDVIAIILFAMATVYLRKRLHELKKARLGLRDSRRQYDATHGQRPAD